MSTTCLAGHVATVESRLSSPRPAPETGETRQNHDLHLWNLHDMHNQDVGHLINELQLWNLYGHLNNDIMGISTAPRQGCQRSCRRTATAEHPQFSARRHHLTNQGSQRFSQQAATVGSQRPPRPASEEPARPAHEGQRPPCQWNLHGQQDGRLHGDLNLHHDRDGKDLVDKLRLRDNDGHVSNLVQELMRVHADASVDTCPRTSPDSRHRNRRLLLPSTHTIREPTLGLPGAALD